MKVVWANLDSEIELETLLPVSGPGAEIKLTGLPPYAPQALQFQLLTGLRPERTGIFDDVQREGYSLVPTIASKDVSEKLIWHFGQKLKNPGSAVELVYLPGDQLGELERMGDEADFKIVTMPQVSTPVKLVDVNHFLQQKGLLERDAAGEVRWDETLAYAVGSGQLWVNLLGREPGGIVTPGAEYQEVGEALIKVLKQMVDPVSQEPVIENIWKKSELYLEKSPYFVQAPDLIITFRPGYAPSAPATRIDLTKPKVVGYTGSYTMAIFGRGIKPGYRSSGQLIDVVPTVLFLLGWQTTELDRDGRVLEEIFEADFLHSRSSLQPIDTQLTAAEEKLLIDRLEALGYIE